MSLLKEDVFIKNTDIKIDNPFPGLRPFKIEESHLFFGREGQSDDVLIKLSKHRFVSIIGPSGSGKSSFVYCGVLPILYGGFFSSTSAHWEVIVFRAGSKPISNLAESLLKSLPDYELLSPEEKQLKKIIISSLLKSNSHGLVESIRQLFKTGNTNFLLLVDQFEELFQIRDYTDSDSIDETFAIINLLLEAVEQHDIPIYVAITMRSDYIGNCAQYPELTQKINDSHYLIPQMTRNQKRISIEGPLAVKNTPISPRLVQQLLNDMGDNPDQLPILQHALMRTWSYWDQYKDFEDEVLDLKHYEAIGTMSEALSMHANEAYEELSESEKYVCEITFKAITEKREEIIGVRRPTRLSEIASIANAPEQVVIDVLEKFRKPDRSLITPAHGVPLTSNSIIDVSHESLMRIWVRLKNWVDDEADAVQMYLRLAEAAAMYQVGKSGLWRPPDLQLALNWQAKHKPTLVWGKRYNPAFERTIIFLEYSKKELETEQRIKELEQKRKLQTARITAIIFGILMVISILFLIYAIAQRAETQRQEASARKYAIESNKNALMAEEKRKVAEEERLRAEEERLRAEKATLQAKSNLELAQLNELIAKRKSKEAIENLILANNNQKKAEENEKQALSSKELADRRRYLAIAKSLALRSRQLNDTTQQALLAQQAFIFNTRYDGYIYDNDIYNGLFAALHKIKHPLTLSMVGHTKAARSIVTNPRTNSIFSGGSDGKLFRWNKQDNEWKGTLLIDFAKSSDFILNNSSVNLHYQIYSMDVSEDGNWLALGGLYPSDREANYALLIDLNDPNVKPKKIKGFVSDIENIHFSPNGTSFYARCNSGKSIMYSDLNIAQEIIAPKERITAIDLSPDGSKLAGVSETGNLYIWNVQKNYAEEKYTILPNESLINDLLSVSFTPTGEEIVVGDQKGEIRILKLGSSIPRRILSGHTSTIEQIKFSHSGKFMASASKDKTIRIWNMEQLKEQPTVLVNHDWVWSISFSTDDEQVMAGMHSVITGIRNIDTDYTIHVWPIQILTMSNILCGKINRNMTRDEWEIFVADDIPIQATCPDLPLK